MTLPEAIDLLTRLIAKADAYKSRYKIELHAHEEIRDGKPFDETQYHHEEDRYIYRQARAEAESRRGQ